MPKIARVACVVAFVVAGLCILTALAGQIVLLPAALIPLMAGVGILRRRVWSAYGYALFQSAQVLFIPLLLFRSNNLGWSLLRVAAAVLMAVLIALFLLAGRSLARAGAERGWAWPWAAVSVLLTLPLIFVQAFVMPSGSMEDTLLAGDRILVQLFPRPAPVRGDMTVFLYPPDRRQTFVKRIIGVPGDRIKISGKVVYRNGTALREPYAIHKADSVDPYRDNFPSEPNDLVLEGGRGMLENQVMNGEVVVPAGKYFVLGDNRDLSLDSRYFGFVDAGDLIGKPFLIYGSEDRSTEPLMAGKPTWLRSVRWNRILKRL